MPKAQFSGFPVRINAPIKRLRATALVAAVLLLVIATLAFGIARSQSQSRSQILAALALRGTSSATFVSAFLANQAGREPDAALDFRPTLEAFVEHTIPYKQHEVYLVDGSGQLIAASPRAGARRLSEANPALTHAIAHSTLGAVNGDATPTHFTVARIPGTSWRLVIGVPDSRLFASISGWTQVIPWLVFALVSVLAVLLAVVFARLMALSERMAQSAHTDSLTGLLNRRALGEHLTRAAAHARRTGQPMSVLMIDLDRFKHTNDHFGHAAGDQVLCAVADCMRDVLRMDDLYGRWGGDEFVILLPTATQEDAQIAAKRLRETASKIDLTDIGLPEGVPMSIGIVTSARTTPDQLIEAADRALYADKAARTGSESPTPRRRRHAATHRVVSPVSVHDLAGDTARER